ncbi:hypothetical protein [Lysinibacillus sphaericus]
MRFSDLLKSMNGISPKHFHSVLRH